MKQNKPAAYWFGYGFVYVAVGCFVALLVAATVRVIMWLLA